MKAIGQTTAEKLHLQSEARNFVLQCATTDHIILSRQFDLNIFVGVMGLEHCHAFSFCFPSVCYQLFIGTRTPLELMLVSRSKELPQRSCTYKVKREILFCNVPPLTTLDKLLLIRNW
jgi:hypothetical protein